MSEEKKELSFEEALKNLEQTVMKMEQGDLSLDENIKFFTEGNKLVKFCTEQLNKAEKKVEVLLGKNSDGEAVFKETQAEDNDLL
ncbi:MAG: exodeoxyribonuclease VII small subunit [Lentisphaeraceae bacterium]|nr:exodeoxyribonuclease VII small subunit [Lentisphaeraceae bacterium]